MLALVLALLMTIGADAKADDTPSDPQRLLDEAKALIEANRWPEACQRLAESNRRDPQIATELRLAECLEHIGRNASAWSHFKAVAEAESALGNLSKQRSAEERAAHAFANVDKLVIVVPYSLPNLEVERDGRKVPATVWNTELPIDQGEHTVHVSAPGKSSYDQIVQIRGTSTVVRVEVPPLEEAIPWKIPGAAPKPTAAMSAPTPPTPARRETPSPSNGVRPFALGLGVLGAIGVASGVVLFAAEDSCSKAGCAPAVALVSAGGVALAVGALLALVGP